MQQTPLFPDLPEQPDAAPPALPEGLDYAPDFLGPDEEAALIALVRQLPLAQAQYKQYTARRRVLSYGGSFDYDANRLLPTTPLVEALHPLRDQVARWAGLAPQALVHTLVAEYAPGTPLGWHRDVPDFEEVMGVSLGSTALLRFRRYPPIDPRRAGVLRLPAEPRSVYRLRGAARWGWQHSVAAVADWRWSITFRTARAGRAIMT